MSPSILIFSLLFHIPTKAGIEFPLGFEGRDIIERDIENLCSLDFDARLRGKEALEKMMQQVLGVEKIDCETLKTLLQDEIGLIVRDYNRDNFVVTYEGNVVNRGEQGTRFDSLMDNYIARAYHGTEMTFAGHTGAMFSDIFHSPHFQSIYTNHSHSLRDAQSTKFYFRYTDDRGIIQALQITDPAPSIIHVSANFFMSPRHPEPRDIYAVSNSITRIALLIHEALHNDDRFDHVECRSYNIGTRCNNDIYGANGIEAIFTLYAANICGGCSDEEKRLLRESGMDILEFINWPGLPFQKERVTRLSRWMQEDRKD